MAGGAHEVGHLRDRSFRKYGVGRVDSKLRRDQESYADRYAVEKLGQDLVKLNKYIYILDTTYRYNGGRIGDLILGKEKFRNWIKDINRSYRGTWLENEANKRKGGGR